MSSKPEAQKIPNPESAELFDLSPKKQPRAAKAVASHKLSEDFRGGVPEALELGKSSMDAAVCMSACALDIYKSACCFAPQLSGYFELASRMLAAYAELQSNYFGLLIPQAEAFSSPEWAASPHEPTEVLERSMDIAMGALAAQVNYFKEVTEASVSYDVLGGSYGEVQPPA
jgi:hypothetical protein